MHVSFLTTEGGGNKSGEKKKKKNKLPNDFFKNATWNAQGLQDTTATKQKGTEKKKKKKENGSVSPVDVARRERAPR